MTLPQKLYNKLYANVKSLISYKGDNPYQFLTIEKINQIRNQFYSILLELFAHYNQFIGKDSYDNATFNMKAFISFGDNKTYKEFYNAFFFANTDRQDKLNNQIFLNFISKQNVVSDKEA